MSRIYMLSVLALASVLTACGGSDAGSADIPPITDNKNISGISIIPTSTSNIIDGDLTTSATVDSQFVVDFGASYKIKEFKLSRVSASASLGSNPDILIELSTDGTTYLKSNASVLFGGVACSSSTSNATSMFCKMEPAYSIRYVRVTVKADKAYDFTEFEAIKQ